MTLRLRKKCRSWEKTPKYWMTQISLILNFMIKLHRSIRTTIKYHINFCTIFFDTTKIKLEQARDSNIQNIIEQLNSPSNQLPFVSKDGILYKLITLQKHTAHKLKAIYLPSSMINSLLRACHDDPLTGAHFSTDRTYYRIRNHYWWSRMKTTTQ